MSEKDLRALIDYASGFAEKRFAKTGVVYPLWHAVKSNGESFVMPAPAGGKDLGVAIIRAAFEIEDVVRYVFMDEAWTLDQPVARAEIDFMQRHGVRAHPDRVEIVMFSGEDAESGRMLMSKRRIIRPANGKPRLGPLEELPTGGHSEGRMVGLLPVKGTRQ